MNTLMPASNGTARMVLSSAAPVAHDLELVEQALSSALADGAGRQPAVARIAEHLRHYRGKRLRPMLLLLSGRACGQVGPAHHTLGAVIELLHTASLVHDDVLDEADTRRHVATVNALWGNKRSILLGDVLFTRAFHMTACLGDARLCELIGDAAHRVVVGELTQTAERGNLRLSEEEYFRVIDGKTAALTECACRLGAIVAGADDDTVARLADFGRCLGLAFQIADDLLDLVGDESRAGKTLGTDLEQQKLTLPLIRLLDGLPAGEADEVRRKLRDPDADRRAVLPLLHDSGALASARRTAEDFAARARAALADLPETDARAVLERLPEWNLRRDR